MKLFLDTADVSVIKDMVPTGLVDGVTTNPSLIAKSGRNIAEVIAEICALVEGPISAEAVSLDCDTMIREGEKLAGIAPNVVVKLPLTWDGLRACRHFADKGIKTNVTLCFSAAQAMLAAKAGATTAMYVTLRLPLEIKDLFREWLADARPDRAARVMSLVRQTRGGKDYDADWAQRMKGAGPVADLIGARFKAAVKRYGLDGPRHDLDTTKFTVPHGSRSQMDLFE